MMRSAFLIVTLLWATPALAQQAFAPRPITEPRLDLGKGKFSLPIVDYQAPDGTWKRGKGIIVGRDVAPNATVGLGFFKMKPKTEDGATNAPFATKSRKVAVGISIGF